MAELIRQFSALAEAHDGTKYVARVYGEQRADRIWVGWIEFSPLDDADSLRTVRETEQGNRDALAYWAAGLERTYLENALVRATGTAPGILTDGGSAPSHRHPR
jgi:hypothetical protein